MSQTLEPQPDPAVPEQAPDLAALGVAEARRARRAQNRRRATYEWIVAIVVAVVVAFVIKTWVAQTFVIPSGSMENTLLIRDRVLVSKLSYRFGDIDRGDIIVFDNPECASGAACQYHQLIKRVVALPGDQVTATADKRLVVNGEVVDEPYLKPLSTTTMRGACDLYQPEEVVTLGADQLLVMGDNRNSSLDGRCFGPIGTDAVIGKAFLRVWPISRIGGL
ncbi:MAG: signal peptidase I [Acidimicrobiia bacterium]